MPMVQKMPAKYDEYQFQAAIDPKTRVAQCTLLKGPAFIAAVKDLPRWQLMQEMGHWVQPLDVIVNFLDMQVPKLKQKEIATELVKMGYSTVRIMSPDFIGSRRELSSRS
jgi:hypothetical protein